MDGDIVELSEGDIADAMALSVAAHWNQNAADWATMLRLGRGWGVRLPGADGRPELAASTVVLPYAGFAWVSMVLVLPEHRGHGLATRLLRHALDWLGERRLMPVLDATPAGHPVYLKEGFVDTWGFVRYRREASTTRTTVPTAVDATPAAATGHGPAASAPRSRPLTEADWPAIAALDAPAFGADRLPLLRTLARRLPAAARVVEGAEGLQGYVLGRDGREAVQIGPLLAADDATARTLLDEALAAVDGPVYADLCDHRSALLPALSEQGFVLQRPFTRMVHGAPAEKAKAPGKPAPCVLVAGPELG